jgi:hypothetical protein
LRCALSIERVTMPGLDGFAVGHLQAFHDRAHPVAREDAHQRSSRLR